MHCCMSDVISFHGNARILSEEDREPSSAKVASNLLPLSSSSAPSKPPDRTFAYVSYLKEETWSTSDDSCSAITKDSGEILSRFRVLCWAADNSRRKGSDLSPLISAEWVIGEALPTSQKILVFL